MVESGWWLGTKLLTASMTMVRLATSYSIVTSAEYNYHFIAVLSLPPPPQPPLPFPPTQTRKLAMLLAFLKARAQ